MEEESVQSSHLEGTEARAPPGHDREDAVVEQKPKLQGFPRILQGFSREDCIASSSQSLENHSETDLGPRCGVLLEGESMISRHGDRCQCDLWPQDSDSVSSCSDQELKEMGTFTDVQLTEDLLQLLDSPLIPGIGMPAILSYKQESRDLNSSYRSVADQPPEAVASNAECEFCGRPTLPFPTCNQLGSGRASELFCCPEYQRLYEFLVREKSVILENQGGEATISLHPPDEDTQERERAKKRAAQRLQERALEKYYQTAELNDPVPNSYSKSMKTISYQLSSCVPKEGSWTVVQEPETPEGAGREEEVFFTFEGGFTLTHSRDKEKFTEKYYANGKKFLTIFPDGSAQVFYPSGNLSILVIVNEKNESACVVQEDRLGEAAIRAIFQSNGKATCYHPNGVVWLSIDLFGGLCLDERGAKLRRWRWSELPASDRPSPFKPLFLSLNPHVGVRVLEQRKMSVSFLALGQQARFSVGTVLQVKEPRLAPPVRPALLKEDLLLLAGRIKLHSALHKLHGCLRFPAHGRPPRAKPPSYLTSLSRRLWSVCSAGALPLDEGERVFIEGSVKDCL
nr:PREDICTED: glutamate-rich protein 6 isoform X1 [Lepisosteus oculatus]